MIKIARSPGIEQIKANIEQEGQVINILSSTTPSIALTPISFKGDSQGLIALAHNPIFHACTKYINIQHHYICNEVVLGRINL